VEGWQHTIDQLFVNAQHMALTIDEELSLHNRLLTELDDDVTVTHSRMKVQMHQISFQCNTVFLLVYCHGNMPCVVFCFVRLILNSEQLLPVSGVAGGSEACAADPAGFWRLQIQLRSLWPGARPGTADRPAIQAVMTPGARRSMGWSRLMCIIRVR
jgi:hypothetical protein